MMESATDYGEKEAERGIRRHLILAFAAMGVLAAGIGVWAAAGSISGAVIATGTVVVETNAKQVQHSDGGIVSAIHVRDGDPVVEGDVLVELDKTLLLANLGAVDKGLAVLRAQQARLNAELSGNEVIDFEEAAPATPQQLLDNESLLMKARRQSLMTRVQQLSEQINQLQNQIDGLSEQRDSVSSELTLVSTDIADLEPLFDQRIVTAERLNTLRRDRARLQGERGQTVAAIAQAHQAIAERRLEINQIEEDYRAGVLDSLREVGSEIQQLIEQRVAAADQLSRAVIKAPRSGVVHQLMVHTIGGVVPAGGTLMNVIPREDLLVLEVSVRPQDVDQLAIGQEARIRFSSFSTRTTPELQASVSAISADLVREGVDVPPYYRVRLRLADGELSKLDGKALLPGMPLEAFLQTESRTVLSYLLKPLSDHISHAMKER